MSVSLIRTDWATVIEQPAPLTTRLAALRHAELHGASHQVSRSEWPLVRDALILASGHALQPEHLVTGARVDGAWAAHLAVVLVTHRWPIAAGLLQRHAGAIVHARARLEGIADGWLSPLAHHLAASRPHGVTVLGDASHSPPTETT